MQFLSDSDKKAIADAIAAAEKTTSGEIVFAISDASGRYHGATLQGALAGMLLASAVYIALPLTHTIGLLLWSQFISFVVFYAVLSRLEIRRVFVPIPERQSRVRDAAFMEFYRSGLYATRDSNGILIYLSLFERHVVVLGDKGIHAKMGDGQWEEAKEAIVAGIRAGRAVDGIVKAVGMCGRALQEHFPYRSDDTNELSNDVIDRTRRR